MNLLPCFHELQKLIEAVDDDLAQQYHEAPCPHCAGKLNRADYPRRPRGGPAHWTSRRSLCCSREGCRRRLTPPSVRFLGRKGYPSLIVVLASALRDGLTESRVAALKQVLKVSRATLDRWRRWWIQTFAASPFWRGARGWFVPALPACNLPAELLERFQCTAEGIVCCLRFIAPMPCSPPRLAGSLREA